MREIDAGTFGNLYNGSWLETVFGAVAGQRLAGFESINRLTG